MKKRFIGSIFLLVMLLLAMFFSQVFAFSTNSNLGNNSMYPFSVNVYQRGYAYILDSVTIGTENPGGFGCRANVTILGSGMLGVYYVKNTFIVDYFNSSGRIIATKSYSMPYHTLANLSSTDYQECTFPYDVSGASMIWARLVIDIHYDNGSAGYGDYIISSPGTGYRLDTDIMAIQY